MRITAIASLLLALAAGGRAAAETPVVLAAPDLPPFYFADADGAPAGVAVDWFRAAAGQAGIAWTATIEPRRRAFARFATGAGHAVLTPRRADLETDAVLRRPEPVGAVFIDAYWRVDAGPVRAARDLRDRAVGVLAGADYGGLLARSGAAPRVVTRDPVALLRVLERGRVDAALLYRATHAEAARALGRVLRDVRRTELARVPIHLYVHRDAPGGGVELLRRLDAAIRVLDLPTGAATE